MMAVDVVTYLPDDILAKVDRAAMAVSLETRLPLLDRDIVEFATGLPLSMKIRDGSSKWMLRQVLGRYVPPALVDRPKAGFGLPIDDWLRGPLRLWAEDLISSAVVGRYLDPSLVKRAWADHIHRRRNNAYELWDVLMFVSWAQSR
jgi:asparagine synthase (glutamine-hydrolysing)